MIKKAMILIIKVYQRVISPVIGQHCRFYPSCSQYTIDSLQRFHFLKALWYSAYRLLRCHPFNRGGYDPVP